MPADPQRLKAALDELHQQLAQIDSLDPAVRDDLTSALRDIQKALGSKTASGAKPLMRRLGESVRHLEESHPALAGSIGSLIDTLGRSGI